MPEPYTLVLELSRAKSAGDRYAFRMQPQIYNRRFPGGAYKRAELSWDQGFVDAVASLRATKRDPEVVQRLGNTIRTFLEETGWSREESELRAAVEAEQRVILTIRSAAAELYAVPWELLALGQTMRHVGELPSVLVRYEWADDEPGNTTPEKPSPRPEGGRILLAHSHAGGRVLANEHMEAIQEACDEAGHEFKVDRDVLPQASRRSLGEALAAARKQGEPIAVLQILCHGGPLGSTFGLMLDADGSDAGGDPPGVDADRLASLLAGYADMIRLVVVMACDSGNTGPLGNQMGSVAQALHRAGVAAVVASRYPISVQGAGEFVRVFYRELLVPPRSVEEAFVAGRQRLSEVSTRLDWASVQLYAREADGFDTRPIVFAPYRGLESFKKEHARFFFGRKDEVDELTRELAALVENKQPRFMVVGGASGTGKSSVAMAGALPQWEKAQKEAGVSYASLVVRPGDEPGEALKEIEAARAKAGAEARLLVVVDQLEEVFTGQPADETGKTARNAFVRTLWKLAGEPDPGISVIATIRIDFLSRCGEVTLSDTPLLRLDEVAYKDEHSVWVAQMDEEALLEAVEGPAEKVGLRLEANLAQRIVHDVVMEPGALPLMSHVLELLWQKRERDMLKGTAYEDLGRVRGALNAHAEKVLEELDAEALEAVRWLLVRLVHCGVDSASDTRWRRPVKELRATAKDAARFDHALERLVQARLLVTSGGKDEAQTVEVAHETLIRTWETLKKWIGDQREKLRKMEEIKGWVDQWKKTPDALLTDSRLGYALEVEKQLGGDLDRDACQLIQESRLKREKDEAEERWKAEELRAALRRAREALQMAGAREMVALGRRSTAALVLATVEEPDKVRGWVEVATDVLMQAIPKSTLPHKDTVNSAAWSPNGKRIVTASADNTARVWDADGRGDPIVLKGHEDSVYSAAWSPDGKRIVTASLDATARVWSADGTGKPIVLRGHESKANSAAWSPDGKRIVTASDDTTARVWSTDGTGKPIVLRGHEDSVWSAAWSPDSKRIVTASGDKTARVWNADGTGDPIVLRDHEEAVFRAAWSPDGERVVTASEDNTARVWNADGTGKPIVLEGHKDSVWSAAWSPDGKRIVTASGDKTARVWNAEGTSDPIVLKGHESEVWSAAWSPDGKRIVTASEDKTAWVWNADGTGAPILLEGHANEVYFAGWSPDGKRIVTASRGATALVWDAGGTGVPLALKGHEGIVWSGAWSPDGKRIVTASDDATALVWDADGTGDPIALKGHRGSVISATWSPDGKRVVTASEDNTARVWNADETSDTIVLTGHESKVNSAEWSPDGKRIVTASDDATALVWSADGTGDPIVLEGHNSEVNSAEWSPDGKRIATASQDKNAQVWNTDGTGDPIVLGGHNSEVNSVAWSPDGKRVVTASADKTARVWNADGTGNPIVLRGHEDSVYSAAWSPDGKRIVTASEDHTARVWNADGTGDPFVFNRHEDSVWFAAWSLDGKRIVTASEDHTARVWNADGTGDSIVIRGHERSVYSAAWSPDGKRIVTTSADTTARAWLLDIHLLRQALLAASTDCLTPDQRETYLLETTPEARKAYEACERSHNRTPYFDAAKPP